MSDVKATGKHCRADIEVLLLVLLCVADLQMDMLTCLIIIVIYLISCFWGEDIYLLICIQAT